MAKSKMNVSELSSKQLQKLGRKLDKLGFRADGPLWENKLKGLGGYSDSSTQNRFTGSFRISDRELSNLYISEGFAKRVVTVVSEDMTRAGFDINNDTDLKLMKSLKKVHLQKKIKQALDWKRLYGGSVIVMQVKAGGKLEKPLKSSHREIENLMVFGRNQIVNNQTDVNQEPESPRFGKIDLYKIRTIDGRHIDVHWSRVVEFKGDQVPDEGTIDWERKYWGDSVIQPIYFDIGNLGSMTQGIMNLILEFVVGKFKIGNLKDVLSSKDPEALKNVLENMNQTKSIINAIVMSPDDEYTRDSAAVTGLPELWEKIQQNLSGKTGIPYSRLYGQQTGGLSAKDETSERNYYDIVSVAQDTDLEPQLNQIILVQNEWLKVTDDPTIESFNPLWEPTPTEKAAIDKTNVEILKLCVETGLLTVDEGRANLPAWIQKDDTIIDLGDGLDDEEELDAA